MSSLVNTCTIIYTYLSVCVCVCVCASVSVCVLCRKYCHGTRSDSAASSPTFAGDNVSEPSCGATVQRIATKTVAHKPSLGGIAKRSNSSDLCHQMSSAKVYPVPLVAWLAAGCPAATSLKQAPSLPNSWPHQITGARQARTFGMAITSAT